MDPYGTMAVRNFKLLVAAVASFKALDLHGAGSEQRASGLARPSRRSRQTFGLRQLLRTITLQQ